MNQSTIMVSWYENYQIASYSSQHPNLQDWDFFISDLAHHAKSIRGAFVYSAGGSPNGTQRKQMREILLAAGGSPSAAILTTSSIARTAITALNLFLGNKIRAFSPTDVQAALAYLDAPSSAHAPMTQALQELMDKMQIKVKLLL